MKTYYEYRLAEEEINRKIQESLEVANGDVQAGVASPSLDNYEELVKLRRRYLGSQVADGLFAAEELQARHLYSSIAIQQNADLSDEEKQVQLQTLQNRLNERLLALGEMTPEEAAANEVQRLRHNGAAEVDIYAAREAILGTEKAQELTAADREEQQWQRH